MAVAELTPKQAQFVVEYLKDLNATQAAVRAGYSEHTAQEQSSRLLGNLEVRAAINQAKAQRVERTKVDADYVINGITRLIDRCESAVAVLDREGNPIGEYRFDGSTAMRGYELLGKHLVMFKDRIEIADVSKRSEAELEEELATLRSQRTTDVSDLIA